MKVPFQVLPSFLSTELPISSLDLETKVYTSPLLKKIYSESLDLFEKPIKDQELFFDNEIVVSRHFSVFDGDIACVDFLDRIEPIWKSKDLRYCYYGYKIILTENKYELVFTSSIRILKKSLETPIFESRIFISNQRFEVFKNSVISKINKINLKTKIENL